MLFRSALPVRYAALLHDLGKGATDPQILPRHHGHEARSAELVQAVNARLKVPSDCRDLALLVAREHGNICRLWDMRPGTIVEMFERADAWRRPERFVQLLDASEADQRGRAGFEDRAFDARAPWLAALEAARAVDAGAIARQCAGEVEAIKARLHEARVRAVAHALGR